MITYKKGNIVEATEKLIVHGCNSRGVMGSGVALAIREKWPLVYNEYARIQPPIELGYVQFVKTKIGSNQYVANAITQAFYGRDGAKYVSYDAIDECLWEVDRWMKINDVDSVAMPKIGAGFGGGNWDVISSIILHRLPDFNVSVYEL